MTIRILKKGMNFSQDGPGNRLVYHLQGCNMHCPWCSNPESMAADGCMFNGKPSCYITDNAEVMREAVSCEPMFFDGGGVTFTGGEPTMQFEALHWILAELQASGINTAIETNGSHPSLGMLYEHIDFLIIDLKHYNTDIHRAYTGVGNEVVIKNIMSAIKQGRQILIRTPLINGFNADESDADGFVELYKKIGADNGMCNFELLRYHEYGKDKWARAGMEYTMNNAFVSDRIYKYFCELYKQNGLNIVRT